MTIALGTAIAACGEDETVDHAVHDLERAARATLKSRSTLMDARITSQRAAYSVRSRIDLARKRFRAEARFSRGGGAAFPRPSMRVIGTGGAIYLARPGVPGPHTRCWFVPHLPIGSAPGIASVEESMTIIEAALSHLTHDVKRAVLTNDPEDTARRVARYNVWEDTSAISSERAKRSGAKRPGMRSIRLVRDIDFPIRAITLDGRMSSISLALPRFRSAAFLPRFKGVERVSIEASVTPSEKRLELHPPGCTAIE